MIFKCAGSGSTGNAYALINKANRSLLLDCGIHMLGIKKMLNFNISGIDGCIVSHSHQDHVLSADTLSKMGIKTIHSYLQDGHEMHTLGDYKVYSFPLPHDSIDNVGYLIVCGDHRILYMTDFEYCKYNFKNHKPTTIIIECNYQDELVDIETDYVNHVFRGHASLNTCKEFLAVNQTKALRNVILCHMSERNADPEYCMAEVQKIVGENVGVSIAARGCEIEI